MKNESKYYEEQIAFIDKHIPHMKENGMDDMVEEFNKLKVSLENLIEMIKNQ